MSFAVKVSENVAIVNDCIERSTNFNPGVSRAYYVAYLSAMMYLIENGVTWDDYLTRARHLRVEEKYLKKNFPFSHDSIWQFLKLFTKDKKVGVSFHFSGIGVELKKKRHKADYEIELIMKEEFVSCVRMAKGILDNLGVKHELKI